MKPAPSARANIGDVVAEWFWRVLLILILLVLLAVSVAGMQRQPALCIGLALGCTYVLLGVLAPKLFGRVHRRAGSALQRPYRTFFKPFLLRPFAAVARGIDALIVGIGRVAEGLVIGALKLGVWVLGIALVLGIAGVAIAGVASLPVSLAVIVGALIVAGAMGRRR